MPRPLPLGEVARRRRDGEGKPAGGSRSGFPSYNLSVSLRSPAPLVGEPLAKPFTLQGLPKPPLGRGGGSASALTERLSPAAALTQAALPSQSGLRPPRPGCGSQRLLRCRSHPAGRCPNSSSLFPPLAAVVAVAPKGGAIGMSVSFRLDKRSTISRKQQCSAV